MEHSKEAITVRLTRLNRQLLGKVSGGANVIKRNVDREALLDALTVLYDECNNDSLKKNDELIRAFLDKYRSALAELRRTRVCAADFEMLQLIGRGYFGDVHMVREKHTGDVYALKTLRKEVALTRRGVACYEEERDILAACVTPWLVKLQYAFQDTTNLYLVMELCPGGDLAALLARRQRPLPERDAAFYVAEVAHALRALHSLGYVHRDVKPHNIFLDRCGHVKLGDFGSAARLTEGGAVNVPVGTPDYVAPELLLAADSPHRHSSACDYWSLGVVAFELVTLKRPFSSGNEDSLTHTLGNIQKYEREVEPTLPFDPLPSAPTHEWRALVTGLLHVQPSRRFHYLDTLQHAALRHLPTHHIRDQPPPWVPSLRNATDTNYFASLPREAPPPNSHIFRSKEPFSGQLPFIGFSFIAPEESDDHSGGFNASHDCTAIDLVAFKSAEKLAAIRGREVAALQTRLAAAEAGAGAQAERIHDEAEQQRGKLQREITELVVQNRRLQRQLEVEHDERRTQERAGLELVASAKARHSMELNKARTRAAELESERDELKDSVRRLEAKLAELQSECDRTTADADTSRALHAHYKNILTQAQELRHRRLTEINVKAIDSIAKERALRRQTLSGGDTEAREAGARVATAEAAAARETRAREEMQRKMAAVEDTNRVLQRELEDVRKELARVQDLNANRERATTSTTEELREARLQLTQERSRANTLFLQVQELQNNLQEATSRECNLEEQRARTESRLQARLDEAEARAAHALQSDARYREKVKTLEQLVRQLEREVTALEARGATERAHDTEKKQDGAASDTESVGGSETTANDVAALAQVALLKEQLERTEAQLQARTEEIAALRQETRTANLARWRKEKELTDIASEAKSSSREVKRLEERLTVAMNARKTSEQKATEFKNELATLKPELDRVKEELKVLREQHTLLVRNHETVQAEVDRSRNDIRKLKSELQYSEKRRIQAEEQAECAMRERANLRDEAAELRATNTHLEQNSKALQEACSIMEEQLTDLEKLADMHEVKNKDLEAETSRMRAELQSCRSELRETERIAGESRTAAALASRQYDEARDQAHHAQCEITLLTERLENRENRIEELETRLAEAEAARGLSESQVSSAARRARDVMEECSVLRTRTQEHHSTIMKLQAQLAEAQEELNAAREAADAAAAWWRTREIRADATLKQQSKLINLLQAKMEETNRKKCSLSNKLFGRSGRRPVPSPPLRKANRELKEEVERLRARLSSNIDPMPDQTPKRDTTKKITNGVQSIDTPDAAHDSSLELVWSDNKREKVRARVDDGSLVCVRATGADIRTRLTSPLPTACMLSQQEAQRAFTVKLDQCLPGVASEATVLCSTSDERQRWLTRLTPLLSSSYVPEQVMRLSVPPACAHALGAHAIAIGCADGLRSPRGVVQLEWAPSALGDTGEAGFGAVTAMAVADGQVLMVRDGMLLHAAQIALASALRRGETLKPEVEVHRVKLPDAGPVQLVQAIAGESNGGATVAVSTGRRVHLLRWDAPTSEYRVSRSLTVDRPPHSLLLTSKALYIAGEKPLRVNLPNGTLSSFGTQEPTIQAAARRHTPPKSILLIKQQPIEILVCFNECGIFVDENGRRTRSEDAKWSNAVHNWAYIHPFLYSISKDLIVISHINDDAYICPPCTCDSHSVASTSTDCALPDTFKMSLDDVSLLGCTDSGVFVRTRTGDGFSVEIVEGLPAMRSVGASVMSLDSVSVAERLDTSSDSGEVKTEVIETAVIEHEVSQDSIEPGTGFQADIRRRAAQLRARQAKLNANPTPSKNKIDQKTFEVVSDVSSDTESDRVETVQATADLCAEMFARQVRFQ